MDTWISVLLDSLFLSHAEFNPSDIEADDDEETLLEAEEEDGINLDEDDDEEGEEEGGAGSGKSKREWKSRVEEELEALKAEGEKPIDELLKDLPPEVLQKPATPLPDQGEGKESHRTV